jgi:hypothetical protein
MFHGKRFWFWLVGAALLASSAGVARAADQPILINGFFERGIEQWVGQYVNNTLPDPKVERTTTMLAWEQKDTAGKSAGALRVTLEGMAKLQARSHNAGAAGMISQNLKAGEEVQVTFKAKSISGGAILKVSRLWGQQTGSVRASLTKEWQSFTLRIVPRHDTEGLLFTLITGEDPDPMAIDEVVDGVFLLDDIVVTPVKP